MEGELFDMNFSALQDSEIDLVDVTQEVVETKTEVDITADGELVTEEVPVVEKKVETPVAKEEDLLDIEDEIKSEEISEKGTPGQEDSSPILPFASLLQEKGFLPHLNLDEFKSSEDKVEALITAFKAEREAYQQDIINSFPEEMIAMAEAISNGVPFEPLRNAKMAELSYSTLTDAKVSEDVNLQKRLVTEFLTEKGFKADKISKYIEKYEDMGDLADEAKDALVELKETSSKREAEVTSRYAAQQKELENSNRQLISNIEKKITDTPEILPGRQLSEDMRKKTLSSMLNIVGNDSNGTPMNGIMKARSQDPVQFDMTVAYLMNLTNNFTDWSKITATAKTSAAKEFEKAIGSQSNTSHKAGAPKTLKGGDVDILEGLKYI